jgi:hypothetical protein
MKAIRRFNLVVVIQSALLTMAPAALRAQDETPDGYVTRKEYANEFQNGCLEVVHYDLD